jgi:23S rRNA-/tRNA-specific pseudouridylate synthase
LLKQTGEPKKVFKLKLEVLLQDEYLAIVNKPSGIPTSGNYFRTVENALPYNLSPSTQIDALPHPRPVHRLDNPTSGLLLIAKTRTAQTILSRDLQNKTNKKDLSRPC